MMDRLPRFRRRAKHPNLKTDSPRPMTAPAPVDHDPDATTPAPPVPAPAAPPARRPQPERFLKAAALKGLHLRSATKRARSPAYIPLPTPAPVLPPPTSSLGDESDDIGMDTAAVPLSSSPASAAGMSDASTADGGADVRVRREDGIEQGLGREGENETGPRRETRVGVKGRTRKANGDKIGPTMPCFLMHSDYDLLSKFQELTWIERNRLAFGSCKANTSRPGPGRQPDVRRAGMDRYCNVKPWDHNRVRLRVAEGALDYVNASPIVVESPSDPTLPPLRYIAMQGPTRQSLEYVWRMVAEQLRSPGVIVQLTNMVENGFQKCFPYFPTGAGAGAAAGMGEPGSDWENDSDGGDEWDGGKTWKLNRDDSWGDGWEAELRCEETKSLAGGAIVLRKLRLRIISGGVGPEGSTPEEGKEEKEEEEEEEKRGRIVWHLLYTRWPDFGVPALEDIESFFELMRLSREYAGDDGATRVVHCSAGVGRTGTFIALEHLMRELDAGHLERYDFGGEHDHDDDGGNAGLEPVEPPRDLVFETVDGLRAQRRTMVQADTQLLFVYRVMKKLWVEKYGDPEADSEDGDGEPAAKRLEVEEDVFTL